MYLFSCGFCSEITLCAYKHEAQPNRHFDICESVSGCRRKAAFTRLHMYSRCAVTHRDLCVQQGALLQALVEQTHLSDCVAVDTVGVIVGAEQQAAQQGGKFKTRGSLTLQHRGGGEQVPGLGQQHTHLHYRTNTPACFHGCVCKHMHKNDVLPSYLQLSTAHLFSY